MYVERATEKYYCFIEICQHLFSENPKSTVRNWCRTLKISTVACEPAERLCFRKGNPSLGGTFGYMRAGYKFTSSLNFAASPTLNYVFQFHLVMFMWVVRCTAC